MRRIRAEIERRRQANEFTPWTEAYVDYKEFYKTRDAVSVADDVGFPRIADAVNTLCGSEYKRFQESWFVPSVMRQWYGDRYRVWFPKLAIGGKAVANGWNNRLSDDGTYIYEYNEDADLVDPVGDDGDPNDIRITFAKSADPVTRVQAYRFVGVFRRISNSEDGTRKRYQRIETVPDSSHTLSANPQIMASVWRTSFRTHHRACDADHLRCGPPWCGSCLQGRFVSDAE